MKQAGLTFAGICRDLDTSGTAWGISQEPKFTATRISDFRSGKTRPTDDLLTALAHRWEDPSHGRAIIQAHLEDELRRAGLDPHDWVIQYAGSSQLPDVQRAIRILDAAVGADQSLADYLVLLAGHVRKSALSEKPDLKVAEKRSPFTPTDRRKRIEERKREIEGKDPSPSDDLPAHTENGADNPAAENDK